MKQFIFISILILPLIISTNSSAQQRNHTIKKETETQHDILPKTKYYVDLDLGGNFEYISLDESQEPQPIQGKEKYMKEFYSNLRYPASARENGIQGVVILEIDVNEKGVVTNINIKKGISHDCDMAAKNACAIASKEGFWPLIIDEKPTAFKMELPVQFSVH